MGISVNEIKKFVFGRYIDSHMGYSFIEIIKMDIYKSSYMT